MVNGFWFKLEDKKVKLLSIDGGAQCSLMQRSHPRLTVFFLLLLLAVLHPWGQRHDGNFYCSSGKVHYAGDAGG